MFNPFSVNANSYALMHDFADSALSKSSGNLTDDGAKYAYFNYDGMSYRVIQARDLTYRIYYYRVGKSNPWNRLCSFRKVGDEWIVYRPFRV